MRRAALCLIILVLAAPEAALANRAIPTLPIFAVEPPRGGMRMRQVIFVDDKSCPPGQIKMVVAPEVFNGPRTRQCVPH